VDGHRTEKPDTQLLQATFPLHPEKPLQSRGRPHMTFCDNPKAWRPLVNTVKEQRLALAGRPRFGKDRHFVRGLLFAWP
jgi:hypothetical protein